MLLLGFAWLTGIDYAVLRLRAASPLGLAMVDGAHLFAGVAAAPILVAKAVLGRRATGMPAGRWHRWMGTSLLVLYGAVLVTGALLIAPLPVDHEALAQAHLIFAVWAAAPTAWHIWHYARRVRPAFLPALGALAVLAVATGFVAVSAPPLSLPARFGDGAAWRPVALPGRYLAQVRTAPDGTLVAGGDGLYVRAAGDSRWRQVGPPDLVLALAIGGQNEPVYLGTTRGLYAAASVEGPYRKLALPSTEVRAVAVLKGPSASLFASSLDGMWRSTDGGNSWARISSGLSDPATAWAVAVFEQRVYASDQAGIYRLDGETWHRVSNASRVDSLEVAGSPQRLFASSIGAGIGVFDGDSWRQATVSAGGHAEPHVSSVTDLGDGRLAAATMSDGVLASEDGGLSWAPLGRLPAVEIGRVALVAGRLLAATSSGLYDYPLPAGARAPLGWWAVAVSLALGSGIAAAALSVSAASAWWGRWRAPAGLRRRRSRPAPGARS